MQGFTSVGPEGSQNSPGRWKDAEGQRRRAASTALGPESLSAAFASQHFPAASCFCESCVKGKAEG